MAMDFIGLSVGMGYTDETVIGGGALKGKNCVVSNIEEVADGVNVTFQWTLDDGTVQTNTAFIPRGTRGETGVAGKSAYEIWLEAGNTGTEEDFLISLVGEKGDDGKSAYQYAQDGGYIGTETEFTTNIARSGVISKELEVERARIDNLTTLQDGSTTGDAELIDARIDKDGNTHVNVGEHIRTVSSQLSSEIDDLLYKERDTHINLFNKDNVLLDTGLDISTGNKELAYTQSTGYYALGYVIPCKPGEKFVFSQWYTNVCFYTKDKKFISNLMTKADGEVVTIPENCYYFCFTHSYGNSINNMMVSVGETLPSNYVPYDVLDIKTFVGEQAFNKLYENTNNVKWCAIGDSLTDSGTIDGDNYVEMVADKLQLNAVNMGVGGTGFLTDNSFVDRVLIIDNDTDVATIFGSFNDILKFSKFEGGTKTMGTVGVWEEDSFAKAIKDTIENIISVKEDIRIGIISPTPWHSYNNQTNTAWFYEVVSGYVEMLEAVAKYYHIPFLNLYDKCNMRPWDSDFKANYYKDGDGVHPTTEGHKKFVYPHIMAFIRDMLG